MEDQKSSNVNDVLHHEQLKVLQVLLYVQGLQQELVLLADARRLHSIQSTLHQEMLLQLPQEIQLLHPPEDVLGKYRRGELVCGYIEVPPVEHQMFLHQT